MITVGVPDPPSGVIDMPMSEAGKPGVQIRLASFC